MQSAFPTSPPAPQADYRSSVEREEIARGRRRDQAREQLEFERERESALLDQLADVITEELGSQVDEAAFAQMDPSDAAVVRETLGGPTEVSEENSAYDDEYYNDWGDEDGEEEPEAEEDAEPEIARLEAELAECRRRRRAYERYLEALGGGSSASADAR